MTLKYNRVVLASLVFISLHSTPAGAALTSQEIGCREAISSAMADYGKTVTQMVVNCHKRRSLGTVPASVDCNDVDQADLSSRLGQERIDLRTDVIIECNRARDLLSQYPSCPAPAAAADDDGDTSGIDNFAEVADCLMALSDARIGSLGQQAMGDPDGTLSSSARKCQGTLGKGSALLVRSIMRERARCQTRADATAAEASYSCEGADPGGRIEKTRARMRKKVSHSCDLSDGELGSLNACSETPEGILACALAAADSTGSSLIRNAYVISGGGSTTTTVIDPPTTTIDTPTTTLDTTTTTVIGPTTTTLPPTDACGDTAPQCDGSCPSGLTCAADGDGCRCISIATGPCAPATIRRTINAKYDTPFTETSLSTGWSGSAHDVDVPNKTGDVVDVTCDENCENCEISLNVQEGNPASNCRCASNPQQTCGVINGPDPACGTVQLCRCYFGAPLALSAGGTPVCVVNRIREDYAGTMNLRTGEWADKIRLASVVHLGLSTTAPCPTCNGDDVANDGIRNGTCSGGLSSGACDVNGDHVTFGPTSFDCLPSAAQNISGGGLLLELNGTTGTASMSAELPCDTPLGENCPCRVCSANSSIGCSSDAECAAADAGTCTAGGGAGVQKNMCENFECGSDSRCVTGPIDRYCDATTHPDGRGFIPCNNNNDCASSGGGACTVIDIRRCFADPIVVEGHPDVLRPLNVAAFCIPPTTNPAVNISGGLPGPGTFALDFHADIRCQNNKELAYEFPDGANCVAGGTTTTTLLPVPQCEDSESPVCGGVCPVGQVCTDNAGACECTGLPLPSCEDATAPVCGGVCPVAGDLCLDNNGTCECVIPSLPQCDTAESPVCGGVCPTGEVCLDVLGNCECQAPGLPACGTASSPTCGGVCDVGQVCLDNGGTCGCTNVLPPCGESATPLCGGSCPIGALCTAVGAICQCTLLPLP
ncbi:MAG TPA: hypothetical protein VEL28_01785 [Candidatus Binatia bacterium]|nr:hypothetical protein [Candidatus Binatia bacterium]